MVGIRRKTSIEVAEREGFEPSEPLQAHAISSRAQSSTLSSFPYNVNVTKWANSHQYPSQTLMLIEIAMKRRMSMRKATALN